MTTSSKGLLRTLWTEYCLGSTVYATRYLAKERLRLGERLWWFFWITSSIIVCSMSIITTYHMYNESPVFISFARHLLPNWAIPFPGVTICPLAKSRVEYFNITDAYYRWTNGSGLKDNEFELDVGESTENDQQNSCRYMNLRVLTHVCPYVPFWFVANGSRKENCAGILRKMSLSIEEMFDVCFWKGSIVPCNSIFSLTLTDTGVCYTFNAIAADQLFKKKNLQKEYNYSTAHLNSANWTMERGYRHKSDIHSYPFRPLGSGFESGLIVGLNARTKDVEYFCESMLSGFKVSIHSPDELPTFEYQFYRLSHLESLILTVIPELTFSSRRLRKYPPEIRQCYFSGERQLRYFKVYNRNNCLAECIGNLTIRECGCVKFSTPRSSDVRVCDASEVVCYTMAAYKVFTGLLQSKSDGEWGEVCDCLPACANLQYDVEISQMAFDSRAFSRAMIHNTMLHDGIDRSILFVVFKNKWSLPLKRHERMAFYDLLAKFGGLFGLMMGASFLSFAELLYFCIIRPWKIKLSEDRHVARRVYPWKP
ncbi:pickpocket protein 28-like [Toxorhynchites rutilus septentrionalis]|uniref:pickpocket protein 28-like n=1 Tax=Toxorhynchites rutilus septentrionalis TaxID=329112 RepID=UPI00247AC714|nr:pickpocket protein 28-like [Toxorhynchites rutilus septentrionalis]